MQGAPLLAKGCARVAPLLPFQHLVRAAPYLSTPVFHRQPTHPCEAPCMAAGASLAPPTDPVGSMLFLPSLDSLANPHIDKTAAISRIPAED